MKILVSGANGMLGRDVCAYLKTFSEIELIETDIAELDVTNIHAFDKYQGVEILIHLAAQTDLELCEAKPWLAYHVNTIGTINAVEYCRKLNIPILYLSTAGVFDGTEPLLYEVTNKPNPINHYGRSKYYGELAVQAWPQHWIVRASWMMGGGRLHDKKFIYKIWSKMINGAKEIKVVNDCIGSPTYTKDLAAAIKNIIQEKFGLYHCAGEGSATRYQVACEIVRILGKDDVKIIPVQADDVRLEFPCQRSKNEVLLNNINYMRHWSEALEEYLKNEFAN